jgi:hypothetical protein
VHVWSPLDCRLCFSFSKTTQRESGLIIVQVRLPPAGLPDRAPLIRKSGVSPSSPKNIFGRSYFDTFVLVPSVYCTVALYGVLFESVHTCPSGLKPYELTFPSLSPP